MPQFISEEEYEGLKHDPGALAVRADEVVVSLQYDAEKLRAKAESEAIVKEQTCAQLEQRYLALAEEYGQLEAEERRLQSALAEVGTELAQARARSHQEQVAKVSAESEAERLRLEVSELQSGRRSLRTLLEQKHLELQEKDAAIKAYLDKIVGLTDGRAAAEGKARAAEEDRQRLQATNARLLQEKEIVEGHTAWLTRELDASTTALTRERQNAAERETEFCTRLSVAEKSGSDALAAAARAAERVATLETALEQAQRKHCEAAEAASERERHFAEELQTAHRLVQLHKESRVAAETKFIELKGVADGLRTAMSDEKEAHEVRLAEERAVRDASAAAAQAALESLEKEVQQAREALQQQAPQASLTVVAHRQTGDGVPRLALNFRDEPAEGPRQLLQLSPLALGATLIKDGATLTEMYSQYQEAADAFRHERQERARVEREYNLLVTEINERLPALATEQALFRSLESSYHSLLEKHADAGVREREVRSQMTALQAQLRRSQREKQGLEHQVAELQREIAIRLHASVAVTHSVREEVAAPGTPPQEGEWQFGDLQELVTKYGQATLRLQQVVEERESEKQEVEERAKAEVTAAYERAAQQVQEIRHHLEVRDAAMAQVKKQAAAFERLWRSASERSGGGMGVVDGGDCLAIAEKAQKDLQDVQVAAEKEKNALLEKMDEARRGVLIAEQAQRKVESALEFERERYRLLEGHFQGQAAELDGLRQRNLEFGASITQFQTQLRKAEQAAQDACDRERRLDTQVAILEREKSLLAAAEARASKEASEISQKKHLAEALLEATRARLESQAEAASAERQRLLEEVARLQHEWRDGREELEGERQRCRALTLARDQAAEDAQQRIQAAETAADAAKKGAAEASAQEAAARAQVAALEEQLRQTDAKLRASIRGEVSAGGVEDEDRETLALAELEKARSALRDLREDLVATQRHLEQYKAIAAANEGMLSQAAQEHERFRAAADATQAATEAETGGLRARVAALEGEVAVLQGAVERRKKEAEAAVEAGVREKQLLQDEVAHMRGALQESEARVAALKEDLERIRDEYAHARAHYEQQVLVQAESIRAQNAATAKLQAAESAAQAALSRAEAAEQLKASSEATWAAEKAALEAQEAEAERKAAQLAEQNRILLDRLEAHPPTVVPPPRSGPGAASEQEKDIQDVLRYLRREKETAETALALARQESARWRTQAEQASKAAEKARAELAEEATRAHRGLQHEEEHHALLAQVAQLNLMRESNSALREEAASNLREATRWRSQARELEGAVGSLKSAVREKEVAAEGASRERELAQQEAQRWRARAEQLTRKFEAVDLEEHRRVVEEVARLEGQLREANEAKAVSATQVEEVKKELASVQAQALEDIKKEKDSLLNRFRNTLRKKDEEIKEARASLESQVAEQEARLKAAETAPGVPRWQQKRTTGEEARKEVEMAKAAADESKKEAENARREAEAAKKDADAARQDAERARAALEAAQSEVAAAKAAEAAATQEAVRAKRAAEEARKEGADADKKSVGQLEVALKDMEVANKRAEVRIKEAEKTIAAEKRKALKSNNENKKFATHIQKLEKEKASLEARLAAATAPPLPPTSAAAAHGTTGDATEEVQPTKDTPTPEGQPVLAKEEPGRDQAAGADGETVMAPAEGQGTADDGGAPPENARTEETAPVADEQGSMDLELGASMQVEAPGGGDQEEVQQQPTVAPASEVGPSEETAKEAGGSAVEPAQQQSAPAGAASDVDAGDAAHLFPAAAPAVSPARTPSEREPPLRRQLLAPTGVASGSPSAPPSRRAPPVKLARKEMPPAAKPTAEEGTLSEGPPALTASPAKRGAPPGEVPPASAVAAAAAVSNKRARPDQGDAAMPEAQRKAREAAAAALSRPSATRGVAPTAAPLLAGPPLGLTPASPSVVPSATGSRPREAEAQEEAPAGKRLRVDALPFLPQAATPQEEVRAVVAADLAEGVAGGALAGSQRDRVQAVAAAEVAAAEEAEKAELVAEAQAMETETEAEAEGALGGGEVGPQELEPGDMDAQRQPYVGEDTAADGGRDMEVESKEEDDALEDGQINEEEEEGAERGEEAAKGAPGGEVVPGGDTGDKAERIARPVEVAAPVVTEANVSLLGHSRAPPAPPAVAPATTEAGGSGGAPGGAAAAAPVAPATDAGAGTSVEGVIGGSAVVAETASKAAGNKEARVGGGVEESKPKSLKKVGSKNKKGAATTKESAPQAEAATVVAPAGETGPDSGAAPKMINLTKVVTPQPQTPSAPPATTASRIARTLGQVKKGGLGRGRGGGGRGGGNRGAGPSPRGGQKKQPTASPPKRNVQGKKGGKGQDSNPFSHLPEDE